MTEDEMAGLHHQLDGHEFEWTPGVGDGQGSLACYDSWSCKELDMTELNWKIIEILNIFSLHVKSDFNKMSFIYNNEFQKCSSNLHINICVFWYLV